MKKTLVLLSIILFLFSCAKEEKPDYLWDEELFVDVLTEVQLAESIIRLTYNRVGDTIYDPDSIYAAALQKMGVTIDEYDSNYNYYLDRPKRFEEVYEKVIIRLSEASALVEKEKKHPASKEAVTD